MIILADGISIYGIQWAVVVCVFCQGTKISKKISYTPATVGAPCQPSIPSHNE